MGTSVTGESEGLFDGFEVGTSVTGLIDGFEVGTLVTGESDGPDVGNLLGPRRFLRLLISYQKDYYLVPRKSFASLRLSMMTTTDTKTQRKLQEFVMQVRFETLPDTLCVFFVQ